MPAPFLSLFLLAPAVDGWLGIYLAPDREQAVVGEVIPDSPAAKAGLQMGDVLLAVDDQATPTRDDFVAAIRAAKAGDRRSLKIQRGGQEQIVVVRLGQRPDQPVAPAPTAPAPSTSQRPGAPVPTPAAEPAPVAPAAPGRGYLGLSVHEADDGIVVDRVVADSPAAKAGVRVGERLVAFGDARVQSLADLDAALQRARAGQQVALGLRSDTGTRSVLVTLASRGETAATAPATASAAVPAPAPTPRSNREVDLEAELAALRAELAELRKQLEALRQGKGRE